MIFHVNRLLAQYESTSKQETPEESNTVISSTFLAELLASYYEKMHVSKRIAINSPLLYFRNYFFVRKTPSLTD